MVMICHCGKKCIHVNVLLEVQYKAFSVQKVIRAEQKIPNFIFVNFHAAITYQLIERNHGSFFSFDFKWAIEMTSLKTNVCTKATLNMIARGPERRINVRAKIITTPKIDLVFIVVHIDFCKRGPSNFSFSINTGALFKTSPDGICGGWERDEIENLLLMCDKELPYPCESG